MLPRFPVDQYNKMFGTNYTVGEKKWLSAHIKGDAKQISKVKTYSVVYNATITVKRWLMGLHTREIDATITLCMADNRVCGDCKDQCST